MNVQRWERVISDEEDAFEKCKQNEEKQRAAIDADKAEIEVLKSEKNEKKKDVDNLEKEVNKARHDVATLAKEIHNINYQISSIDTKVETKKNERHNILIQSKVKIERPHPLDLHQNGQLIDWLINNNLWIWLSFYCL